MDTKKYNLEVTRIFDAPRELVFRAWIEPKLLAQWFGPKVFTNPTCEVDARVGGKLFIVMRAPDGADFPCGGVFRKIEPPHELVFTTTAFPDEDGNAPLENLNTVTFTEENGKTKVTLKVEILKATPEMEESLKGMSDGWNQSLDKFAEHLPLWRKG